MATHLRPLLPSKSFSFPLLKSFCTSSTPDTTTQTHLLGELRNIRILIQQKRTETANKRLKLLIPHHSVSELFASFSQLSPPPDIKPDLADALLTVYAKAKLPNEAAEMYSLVRRDGAFTSLSAFNVLLQSLVDSNQFDRTLGIFAEAMDCGGWMDKFSYGKAIQSAVKLGDLDKGFELMNLMKKRGIMANGFVYNVLIGGLCRERRVNDAENLFDEMSQLNISPNRVAYNSLIDGIVK